MIRSRVIGNCVVAVSLLAVAPVARAAGEAVELYWAGSGSGLHRMPAAGGPSEPLGAIPTPDYGQMTIFDGKLYWFTDGGQSLMRSALDGTGRAPADPSSLPADVLLALRGGVRLTGGDVIFRLEADPVSGQTFSPGASVAADVANGKLYWAGGWNNGGAGLLGRSDLDGSNPQTLLQGLGFEDYTLDLVLDVTGGKMYWNNPNLGKIQRANLDGTGLEDIAVGVDPTALAIHNIPEPGAPIAWALAMLLLSRRRAAR